MLGWETQRFPELKVIHWRSMGTHIGMKGIANTGRAAYYVGWHPIFMVLRCVRRMFDKPYLVREFLLLYGYIEGYLKKSPQIQDKSFIKFLRKQQINRLLLTPTIWK